QTTPQPRQKSLCSTCSFPLDENFGDGHYHGSAPLRGAAHAMTDTSRLSRYIPAAAIAVVASAAGWLAMRSLQQDLAAYWVAGAARSAGLDPYVNHVGGPVAPELWDGVAVFAHSRFLYPPLIAELFRPLARLP